MNSIFSFEPRILTFKTPAITSRGVLTHTMSFFLHLSPHKIGEVSIIPGLSPDNLPSIESILQLWQSAALPLGTLPAHLSLHDFPALQMGLEMLALCKNKGNAIRPVYFPAAFADAKLEKVKTNTLIWGGAQQDRRAQIVQKLAQSAVGCLKIKISKESFAEDLALMRWIRQTFDPQMLLRLDANGAFSFEEALPVLEALAPLNIEYLEQPIAKGQPEKMQKLCKNTPFPLALDEELIGLSAKEGEQRVRYIRPQVLVLKPSLIGGFEKSLHYMNVAKTLGIKVRVTSALEANVGLNALLQFTAAHADLQAYHGLGTGQLFVNNTPSY